MSEREGETNATGAQAAAELLPAVYAELRRLATSLASRLPPGQTLQPTALVHEAYLRLADKTDVAWESRRHFFVAAARVMRDILVEQARRKAGPERGGRRSWTSPPCTCHPCGRWPGHGGPLTTQSCHLTRVRRWWSAPPRSACA
jgi:RNA polymerase sigma factor (TIGR02999 family)